MACWHGCNFGIDNWHYLSNRPAGSDDNIGRKIFREFCWIFVVYYWRHFESEHDILYGGPISFCDWSGRMGAWEILHFPNWNFLSSRYSDSFILRFQNDQESFNSRWKILCKTAKIISLILIYKCLFYFHKSIYRFHWWEHGVWQ